MSGCPTHAHFAICILISVKWVALHSLLLFHNCLAVSHDPHLAKGILWNVFSFVLYVVQLSHDHLAVSHNHLTTFLSCIPMSEPSAYSIIFSKGHFGCVSVCFGCNFLTVLWCLITVSVSCDYLMVFLSHFLVSSSCFLILKLPIEQLGVCFLLFWGCFHNSLIVSCNCLVVSCDCLNVLSHSQCLPAVLQSQTTLNCL